MYKINDGEYSDALPSATNVGNYDITYYVKGDSNHSDLAETSLTSVSILANDKTELVSTLASTNDYYDSIKDDYPLFASNLKLALDNGNAINSNDNVTVEQITEAINTLQSAKQAATNNVTKVVDVVTKIDAIGVVTLEKENDIIAVRNSYNALSEAEKAEVGEVYLSKLVNAEKTLKALKDKKAADEVKTLIDNIGEVVLSDECHKKIETAKAAYDSLTPEQKSLISEANEILAEKETIYNQLSERNKKAMPMLIVSISVAAGVILVLVLLYFLPFIINKRYIIDTNNNKIKRVAYIKESDGMVLLITHSFRKIRCNESEVYNNKAEAEEALNKSKQ
ncbi:MAG: hypothetical protein E7178_01400 [Erysipelotrichaceae bacterium]|nr:hypothetical protein [Erysipelotrichaceae bacterium]